jgi:hypothetical protein
MEQDMKRTLIIATLAAGLGFSSVPTFAKGYVVNGHTASAAEEHFLASHGFEPGAWVVDGWGISPAATEANVTQAADKAANKCRYVLDVLLCR